MFPRLRFVLPVIAFVLLILPAGAHASHIMGGSLDVRVADDRLQGTITYSERMDPGDDCVVGDYFDTFGVTFLDPSLTEGFGDVDVFNVRCIPGQRTVGGGFDFATATDLGLNVEDGVYTASYSNCCRIGGIENGDSDTEFRAQVTRDGAAPSSSPQFGSLPVTGVAVGFEYRQNLNAFDPDTPLSYLSQVATPTGPTFDVVTFEPNGDVVIPAAVTATFTDGQFYVYKVRVTDSAGNYSERDVLLLVTDGNTPPAFQGVPASVQVPPGETREVDFTATDGEAAQTVTVSPGSLPPWATLTTTPGNPAAIRLTLSPPSSAEGTTETISLDAIDDHPDVPLSASATVAVSVQAAAPGSPDAPGTPGAQNLNIEFGSETPILGERGLPVTCLADAIASCVVEVTADTLKLQQPSAVVAAKRKRRAHLIAFGQERGSGDRLTVNVRFTKFGRKLIRKRIGGRRVTFRATALAADGRTLSSTVHKRVLPPRNALFTRSKDFKPGSAKLTNEGSARVRRVADRLRGGFVAAIRCHGFGEAGKLARARASEICSRLRSLGLDVKYRIAVSDSDNERVGIKVTYR